MNRRYFWLQAPQARAVMCTLFAAAQIMSGIAAHAAAQTSPAQATSAMTARASSPKDLTGYWVSVVTEDWRWRMVMPDKGDYASVPLNAEGRKLANTWDAAKDQASGNQCRSYGAAGVMRVPGRLHIYWADDSTLRIDTDAGTQTRLLHFAGSLPVNETPQWQGYSVASWDGRAGQGAQARRVSAGEDPRAYLKVTTTHMRPGYLRKNGVPYSANAALVEYFDRFSEPNGDTWLLVTTIVTDPQYLTEPFVTSTHFKKIPDASGWDPTPCRADQPR